MRTILILSQNYKILAKRIKLQVFRGSFNLLLNIVKSLKDKMIQTDQFAKMYKMYQTECFFEDLLLFPCKAY